MHSVALMTSRIFLTLGLLALAYLAVIALGLFIFFKGRAHVRRKYGDKR